MPGSIPGKVFFAKLSSSLPDSPLHPALLDDLVLPYKPAICLTIIDVVYLCSASLAPGVERCPYITPGHRMKTALVLLK